jgi:hypothetical protein
MRILSAVFDLLHVQGQTDGKVQRSEYVYIFATLSLDCATFELIPAVNIMKPRGTLTYNFQPHSN